MRLVGGAKDHENFHKFWLRGIRLGGQNDDLCGCVPGDPEVPPPPLRTALLIPCEKSLLGINASLVGIEWILIIG